MFADLKLLLMGKEVRNKIDLRVRDTPITVTKAGFTGIGVRAAYCSICPVDHVVEFMTYNFSMQAIDQIINHVAKSNHMFVGQTSVVLYLLFLEAQMVLHPGMRWSFPSYKFCSFKFCAES
ncbi:hypothetical protein MKX01_032871 [Papaver californicum]|nr:hypothetical protein MKX01_032871 [Papaver californicum]